MAYNFTDDPGYLARVEIVLEEMLGRPATLAEVMAATGIPAGSDVKIRVDGGAIKIEGSLPNRLLIEQKLTPGGLKTELFYIWQGAGQGLGTRYFTNQVRGAAKLGIKEMRLFGAKSAGENGYYTWARLGYDGALAPSVRGKLSGNLAGATRVSDLMRTSEGRAWWKANGEGMDMTFDLRPGSLSRRVFNAYVRERAKRG